MKKFLIAVYGCLLLLLAATTFVEQTYSTDFVEKHVYHTIWFCCLWGALAAMTVVVLVRQRLWRRLPTLLLHGSFLVILAGAMTTFLCGRKGYVHLTVGSEVNCFLEQDGRQVVELPFTLRLDSFRIEYYPGTDAPADYISYIHGETPVSMNRILSRQGFRFYQSSIRYADDIVLLAKSKRASERLLESSTKYLEKRLKLTVNREKSRTVSVFAIRNFKFLGFALGRNGKGIYVRVHPKSWKKFKSRLKELSSRKRCQSIKPSLEKIKVYARGWLNYYGIASMKNNIDDINGWLYHRIRMCIWKQWKKPRTKVRNLIKMGVPKDLAMQAGNTRRGHWFATHTVAVNMAMTKERLINRGFYDLATAYQSVHVNY